MKNTKCCPKCSSQNIACVPDDAHRYLANSICITKFAVVKRIPVIRYVCCDCGYVENWVETQSGRARSSARLGKECRNPIKDNHRRWLSKK